MRVARSGVLGLAVHVLLICRLFSGVSEAQTVPSQWSVNAGGGANYSVPIQAPLGVSGLEPKLSLVYSSGSRGADISGLGWSLSGLSSIQRCSQSIKQDGVKIPVPVALKPSDRFCIDGARLNLVGGEYGGADSVYRSEIDDRSDVKASLLSGVTGPAKFVVRNGAGLTMEFGGTPDSRIMAGAPNQTVVSIWAISKITDVSGNYLSVSYAPADQAGGYALPAEIKYGGAEGAAVLRRVVFEYETRPDVRGYFGVTGKVELKNRLSKIKGFVGADAGLSYTLLYDVSPNTKLSRLRGVRLCSEKCLPDLTFAYSASQVSAQSWAYSGGHGLGDAGWDIADIFGDGRPVYWTHSGNGMHYATRLNLDGTLQNWTWSGGHGVASDPRLVSLFGDGRKVYWTQRDSTHYITQLNSDGTLKNWTVNAHGRGSNGFDFVDLFGEGREVYWTRTGSTHYASRFNADGSVTNWTWVGGHNTGDAGSRFVDLFGDGRREYWTRTGGTHFATRLNSDGTFQNWTWVNGHGQGSNGFDFADFFGDGRDMYWTRTGATHFGTQLNADGTLVNWTWSGGHNTGSGGTRLVDLFGTGRKVYWTRTDSTHFATQLNADGTLNNWTWTGAHSSGNGGTDFADIFGDGRQVYWTRNDANHFFSRLNLDGTSESWNISGHSSGSMGTRVMPIFGNGRPQYWTANQSTGTFYVTSFAVNENDVLSEAVDGFKNVMFKYQVLPVANFARAGTYQISGAALGQVSLGTPTTLVVSEVVSANGLGGTKTQQHSYGNFKSEWGEGARGSLGFQWTQTKDMSTGVVSRTCYRQAFPYIGMVDKAYTATSDVGLPACEQITGPSALWAAGSNLLSLSTNDYDFNAFASNDALYTTPLKTVAPGNRYQIQTPTSQSQSRDWDSQTNTFRVLPATRTTTKQDNWGNVTEVKTETLNTDGATSSGYSKTTTDKYADPDVANWRIGRVVRSSVTATAP
jgi:hypothetical protein